MIARTDAIAPENAVDANDLPEARRDKHVEEERLFERCMEQARQSNVIEYRGEFGYEIASFIPFVNWLNTQGHLHSIRIKTFTGMRPYYFFLDDRQMEFKEAPRRWEPPGRRIWPGNNLGVDLHRSKYHLPPDYRTAFRGMVPDFARPVLFVQNKFQVEWQSGPINYFPLKFLRMVFAAFQDRYTIFYSRPRGALDPRQFSRDHNSACEYPDASVLREFKNVISFEDWDLLGQSYNERKLSVLAGSHLFLAVQGGGAQLLSCFGHSVMFVLHQWGIEYPGEYRQGRYKQLADPPPQLFVVRTWKDLAAALQLFDDIELTSKTASVGPKAESLLAGFRM
jgi:hypothetical protein